MPFGFEKPRVLLVDLHGTLVPTAQVLSRIFAETLASVFPAVDKRALRKYYLDFQGTPLEQKVAAGLSMAGKKVSVRQQKKLVVGIWKRVTSLSLYPYSETVEDLKRLKSKGWLLFLSTDNPLSVAKRMLLQMNVESLFDGVLGKPASGEHKVVAHVRLLARRFKIPERELAKHFVFYGDSLGEMKSARKIGILAIGRTTSYSARKMRASGAQKIVAGIGRRARGRLHRHLSIRK